MSYVSVYFSLGSNEGDRMRNLSSALSLLDSRLDTHYGALSSIIETPAWGFAGNSFLNACVRYRIRREGSPESQALSLLSICKDIERELGRMETLEFDKEGNRIYHNRPIDIDILFFGYERIENKDLVIPHSHLLERVFFHGILREISSPYLRRNFPEYFSRS